MSVEHELGTALIELAERFGNDATLFPTRLATAIARVLPADGASLSIADQGFRLPLGASDDISGCAERLQFTAGEGPCLTAIATGAAVSAAEPELRARWPELAELWLSQTGFRSAASRPLLVRGRINTALNLFFRNPDAGAQLDQSDLAGIATAAARHLSGVLDAALAVVPGAPATRLRNDIWIAVGMAMSRWELNGPDALARLRAHAYSSATTVDALAARLIERPDTIAALDA